MLKISRRQKIILLCAALGVGGYASYKVLNSSYMTRKRKRVATLVGSLFQLMEIFSAGVDSTSLVASDLRSFLLSDDDHIPRSLRQSLKIARSREFQDALTVFSSCVSRGLVTSVVDCIGEDQRREKHLESNETLVIVRSSNGSSSSVEAPSNKPQEGLPERFMQKLFSEPGVGFASAVLGSVARTTVLSALEGLEKLNRASRRSSEWDLRGLAPDACGPAKLPEDSSPFMDVICTSKGRAMIAECVQAFVGTAVSVYLEKTKDINLCEQLIAGVTKPSHRPAVDELLTSVCSGAVETFVRTSHQVLSAPKPDPAPRQEPESGEAAVKDVRTVNEEMERVVSAAESSARERSRASSSESVVVVTNTLPNWVEGVSRTLAVPSNRKLLIDVAGTVTSEAIHSFFEVFFGVIGPYIRSNFKLRSSSICRGKSRSVQTPVIIEKGVERSGGGAPGLRFEVMARALVVFTVCLAIIMHLLVDLPIQHLQS